MTVQAADLESVEELAQSISGDKSLDALGESAGAQAWGNLVDAGLVATDGLDVDDSWLAYACAVLRGAYRHPWRLPLAEAVIARGLFGLEVTSRIVGKAALAVVAPGDGEPWRLDETDGSSLLSGTASGVPWSPVVEVVLVAAVDGQGCEVWALVRGEDCEVVIGENVWGAPSAAVAAHAAPVLAHVVRRHEEGIAYARSATAAAIAGCLSTTLAMSVAHARQREQFGRPIWSFQTVKHQLVVAAECSRSCRAVSLAAANSSPSSEFEFVSLLAKTTASRAASTVTQIAHHVHGALGIVEDFDLGRQTRQLFDLRDRFGSEFDGYAVIADRIRKLDTTAGSLWRLVADL